MKRILLYLSLFGLFCFCSDDAQQIKPLKKCAIEGDMICQYTLGAAYWNGELISTNKRKAMKWFRLSADQGFGLGEYMVGVALFNGEGVSKSRDKALIWLAKSANHGNEDAILFLNNEYNENDIKKILAELLDEKEAEAGVNDVELKNKDAQEIFELALTYERGEGAYKNANKAFNLFKIAAERGLPAAQSALAKYYFTGEGVAENQQEGVRWLTIAAEGGDEIAQLGLLSYYLNSYLVQENRKEEIKRLRHAIVEGEVIAINSIED